MHDRTEKEIHFSVRVFKATVPELPALFHILYKSPLRMSILGHTLISYSQTTDIIASWAYNFIYVSKAYKNLLHFFTSKLNETEETWKNTESA